MVAVMIPKMVPIPVGAMPVISRRRVVIVIAWLPAKEGRQKGRWGLEKGECERWLITVSPG